MQIGIFILAIVCSPLAVFGQDCSSCHSGIKGLGEYLVIRKKINLKKYHQKYYIDVTFRPGLKKLSNRRPCSKRNFAPSKETSRNAGIKSTFIGHPWLRPFLLFKRPPRIFALQPATLASNPWPTALRASRFSMSSRLSSASRTLSNQPEAKWPDSSTAMVLLIKSLAWYLFSNMEQGPCLSLEPPLWQLTKEFARIFSKPIVKIFVWPFPDE